MEQTLGYTRIVFDRELSTLPRAVFIYLSEKGYAKCLCALSERCLGDTQMLGYKGTTWRLLSERCLGNNTEIPSRSYLKGAQPVTIPPPLAGVAPSLRNPSRRRPLLSRFVSVKASYRSTASASTSRSASSSVVWWKPLHFTS